MIGILILVVSIVLYITGNRVWSIVIFLSFVAGTGVGGFTILVDSITGVKNEDLGFLYVIIINLYSFCSERNPLVESHYIRHSILIFLLFMTLSIIYSIVHYDMTIMEIIQGSRQIFYFTSYFFLRKLRPSEIKKIIGIIFIITLITSIIYIYQSITGTEVLPNSEQYHSNNSISFLNRYYNFPPFLVFCIIFTLLCSSRKEKYYFFSLFVFSIALICTQGRTLVIITAMFAVIGIGIQGRITQRIWYGLPIVIAFMLMWNVLSERFEGERSTSSELMSLTRGDFVRVVDANGEGSTMSFRLAWCLERMHYLSDRPLLENVFGLSLLSDQQKRVQQMYHFRIGNINSEARGITQLSTPDIAYGNMLTKLGYCGSIIFLAIWVSIIRFLYNRRNRDPFILTGFVYVCLLMFTSFTGRGIFYTGNMAVPFMFVTYSLYHQRKVNLEKQKNGIS